MAIMAFSDYAELEFIYKPNAFRRRDYRARNFSNRDNFTRIFAGCFLPDIGAEVMTDFDYDPFVTRISVQTGWNARNVITFLNVADENCFGLAADRPLTILLKPRGAFEISDGRLIEKFEDRGEEIVSFVFFSSYEADRFRLQSDGSAILQIFENEVVWFGAEESRSQVARVAGKLGPMTLQTAIARNEALLAPVLDKAKLRCADPDFQKVIDLNKRVILSGMDAGGACFGALNRIYYLIWNRDGAMTSAMLAGSGIPDFVQVFARFIVENPSVIHSAEGRRTVEYLQILGSRWTKSEDDGIYYAALSVFSLVQTTGNWDLLRQPSFQTFYEALDITLENRFDAGLELFGSDTLGETTLQSSPLWGYDTVNGSWDRQPQAMIEQGKPSWRVYTLYHNVNLFNTLKIAAYFLRAQGDPRADRYESCASLLQRSLNSKFVQPDGTFYSGFYRFEDGSSYWSPYEKNPWEYTWAATCGPFFPNLKAALLTARRIHARWQEEGSVGYCPWNWLSRTLKEYGMSSGEFHAMLSEEVSDAGYLGKKYPMRHALTEYQNQRESWRPLPFSAGSFLQAVSSLLLQPLACGLAVRASDFVESIERFQFRTSLISATSSGGGDVVGRWTLNGREMDGTLQIPEQELRMHHNVIEVERVAAHDGFRLFSSSASLLRVERSGDEIIYRFSSPVAAELVLENAESACSITVLNSAGEPLDCSFTPLPATNKTVVSVNINGDFAMVAKCRS